jgi:hypothetical protein
LRRSKGFSDDDADGWSNDEVDDDAGGGGGDCDAELDRAELPPRSRAFSRSCALIPDDEVVALICGEGWADGGVGAGDEYVPLPPVTS